MDQSTYRKHRPRGPMLWKESCSDEKNTFPPSGSPQASWWRTATCAAPPPSAPAWGGSTTTATATSSPGGPAPPCSCTPSSCPASTPHTCKLRRGVTRWEATWPMSWTARRTTSSRPCSMPSTQRLGRSSRPMSYVLCPMPYVLYPGRHRLLAGRDGHWQEQGAAVALRWGTEYIIVVDSKEGF